MKKPRKRDVNQLVTRLVYRHWSEIETVLQEAGYDPSRGVMIALDTFAFPFLYATTQVGGAMRLCLLFTRNQRQPQVFDENINGYRKNRLSRALLRDFWGLRVRKSDHSYSGKYGMLNIDVPAPSFHDLANLLSRRKSS